MAITPQLQTLAEYLVGEFDNREQALNEPVWYVHLRLWHRPVTLFTEDSLTIFAEQANIVKLDQPYRQRILRVQAGKDPSAPLTGQFYMLKHPGAFSGAGRKPELLNSLTPNELEFLPGCILNVTHQQLTPSSYQFTALPPTDSRCCFTYDEKTIQVALGFSVNHTEFLSYDKGVDPVSGAATWGAIMGPYRYTKREKY